MSVCDQIDHLQGNIGTLDERVNEMGSTVTEQLHALTAMVQELASTVSGMSGGAATTGAGGVASSAAAAGGDTPT